MAKHWYIQLVALILGIIVLTVLVCMRGAMRKVPANYIALFSFTAIWSYVVASICAMTSPQAVLIAAVCTSAMFVGLTCIACFVKTEKLTYCWALLSVLGSLAVPLVIFMIIFRSKMVHTAITVVLVALASLYIVYDTK